MRKRVHTAASKFALRPAITNVAAAVAIFGSSILLPIIPSTSLARMPVPVSSPDCYLFGVKKIYVKAEESFDASAMRTMSGSISLFPIIDLNQASNYLASELRKSLPQAYLEHIIVEAYTPQQQERDTVLLKYQLGYSVLNDRPIAALYAVASRMIDGTNSISSALSEIVSPVPFELTLGLTAKNENFSFALKRTNSSIVDWLTDIPIENSKKAGNCT